MNKVIFKTLDLQGQVVDEAEYWCDESLDILLSEYLLNLKSMFNIDSCALKVVVEVNTAKINRSAEVGCFIIGAQGIYPISESFWRLVREV